ncbi:hypothetical protein M4D57_26005 [Brevibacillus borstelensis]|uniref:hypothetical protein n=1 Tax=Brevibacillus borstelensis TaxID=45462 RepID=UPI00203D8552|nr:hypothetical protein [Brevibacillus borstelensis]MCM3561938.1 hypothetical protein [Brevibacillus borstelensis]
MTFSEGVYTNDDATGALDASDFSIDTEGGSATVAINSVTHVAGTNVAEIVLDVSGTPTGAEVVTITPANATAIYDGAGNATTDTQSVDVTLVDKTAPKVVVTPASGASITDDEDFELTIVGTDVSELASLEVDHSVDNLPEFTLYADVNNPWGSTGAKQKADEAGVVATYDADAKTWKIKFTAGGVAHATLIKENSVTFYFVVKDAEGNAFGDMNPPTAQNTFTYNVTTPKSQET